MAYKNIVDEIERLRNSQMLSVLEMSAKIGLSYAGLRRILDGVTVNVQEGTIRNIAKAFDCEIETEDNNIYFVKKNTVNDNETVYTVKKSEKEFIDALNGLPEKTRAHVMRIIKEIVKLREG